MTVVVKAESLIKRFGEVSAVTDLSFALEAGTITGFLIEDISRNENEGIGKTEPLRHEWASWWSRRITQEHRLIYRLPLMAAGRGCAQAGGGRRWPVAEPVPAEGEGDPVERGQQGGGGLVCVQAWLILLPDDGEVPGEQFGLRRDLDGQGRLVAEYQQPFSGADVEGLAQSGAAGDLGGASPHAGRRPRGASARSAHSMTLASDGRYPRVGKIHRCDHGALCEVAIQLAVSTCLWFMADGDGRRARRGGHRAD
jgi:Txe/YoeB family toxin of toxin-antitoxin system